MSVCHQFCETRQVCNTKRYGGRERCGSQTFCRQGIGQGRKEATTLQECDVHAQHVVSSGGKIGPYVVQVASRVDSDEKLPHSAPAQGPVVLCTADHLALCALAAVGRTVIQYNAITEMHVNVSKQHTELSQFRSYQSMLYEGHNVIAGRLLSVCLQCLHVDHHHPDVLVTAEGRFYPRRHCN